MSNFDQSRYTQDYIKEHCKQVPLLLPRAMADELDAYCKLIGEKRQTFIKRLIMEEMQRYPKGRG